MVNTFFALLLIVFVIYSKTSNNGPSEKRTTSVQRTAHLPPINFTMHRTNTLRTSEKRTPLNSTQRTLISPQSTLANTSENGQWSYTHIMRTPFVTPPSMDSKTENCISTVAHCASLSRQRKGVNKRNSRNLCFHASSLPCLHTFWHAIPTSFYIFNVFIFYFFIFLYYIMRVLYFASWGVMHGEREPQRGVAIITWCYMQVG